MNSPKALRGPLAAPISRASSEMEPPEPSRPLYTGSQGLGEIWSLLWLHKLQIILIASAGLFLGFTAGLLQQPMYQARASIELEAGDQDANVLAGFSSPNSAGYSGETFLQTQLKILQSRKLIERVAIKMNLAERPEFQSRPGRLAAFRARLGFARPSSEPSMEALINHLAPLLNVRNSLLSRVVEITFESPDAKLAAQFVNTMVREYIDQSMESRWEASQRRGEWLARQIDELKPKLEQSGRELQAYARAGGLLFPSEKGTGAEEMLRQLQTEVARAQADRAARQSQYETALSSPPETLGDVLGNGTLRESQVTLLSLRRQMAELSSTFTPEYYKVQRLKAQIAELESALRRERATIMRRLQSDYEAAKRHQSLLAQAQAVQQKVVLDQNEKLAHYNLLKREHDTTQQLYDSMLQKVKEAGVASALRATNIHVVDPAWAPSTPYSPNGAMNAAIGLLVGFLGSIAFVVLRDRIDSRVRRPGESWQVLHVPELGTIPSFQLDPNPRASDGKVTLVNERERPSPLIESFRATLASILFAAENGPRRQVLVVTSLGGAEGKTTVLGNLAIALSALRRRVLLIDADLRRPRLHDVFNLENNCGLADILQSTQAIDTLRWEQIARPAGSPHLWLLPSGPADGALAGLFHSERMADLLASARREFDTILIDTPPMMQFSDARVLGRICDSVILVIRANRNSPDRLQACYRRLVEDNTPVLGTILNDWNPRNGMGGFTQYDDYERYAANR